MTFFFITFVTLVVIICLLDLKYNLLRDESTTPGKKPYSFSRVQMAWWTVIILTALITIFIESGKIPELNRSSLILLGIGAGTLATARIIDGSDQSTPGRIRHQNNSSSGFIIDILSDENGASMHRFQTIAFNLLFGIWFVGTVLTNMKAWNIGANVDNIMPTISNGSLVLLGLSAATYAAVKTTENKP